MVEQGIAQDEILRAAVKPCELWKHNLKAIIFGIGIRVRPILFSLPLTFLSLSYTNFSTSTIYMYYMFLNFSCMPYILVH